MPARSAVRPSQTLPSTRRGSSPAPPPRRRSSGRRTAAILIGALAAVGAIAVLIVATSGTGKPAPSGSARASNTPKAKRSAAAFTPASVTVAVLNGTATNNLAHTVAARLAAEGYREGRIATAADQTMTVTTVGYLPGNRPDALHVAGSLRLGPASVAPVGQSSQQVACPSTSACTANVVVTVGADLATS